MPLPLLLPVDQKGRKTGRRKAQLPAVQQVDHPSGTVHICPADAGVVQSARAAFESLVFETGSKGRTLLCKKRKLRFHVEHPPWKSDIRWISSADARTLATFWQPLFDRMRLRELFCSLGEMVLFSGYFVSRQCTRASRFHADFGDTGGKAFTLMTPLYDMSALSECHLLAERSEGGPLQQFRYELGQAVIFGDRFVHATQTGDAPSPLCFLCFTFGDRRMTATQWEAAEYYIANQCVVYYDPSGKLVQPSVGVR